MHSVVVGFETMGAWSEEGESWNLEIGKDGKMGKTGDKKYKAPFNTAHLHGNSKRK